MTDETFEAFWRGALAHGGERVAGVQIVEDGGGARIVVCDKRRGEEAFVQRGDAFDLPRLIAHAEKVLSGDSFALTRPDGTIALAAAVMFFAWYQTRPEDGEPRPPLLPDFEARAGLKGGGEQ